MQGQPSDPPPARRLATPSGPADGVGPEGDLEVSRRLDAALAIAREVGELTLSYFQNPSLKIEMKSDGSPVTEADKLAEATIRAHVARSFPSDGVLGEEEGETRGTSGYRWILDPIDGTRPFSRGIPTFSNLIAIEREAIAGDTTSLPEIVAGVAGFPAMQELLWAGEGRGAWWETARMPAQTMRVARVNALEEAVVDTLSPQTWEKYGWSGSFEKLWRGTRRVRSWSDSYSFALVATGRVDAAVDFGAKIWDVAPFAVMMAEAGGVMSCFRGSPCLTTGTYIAGNAALHERLMGVVGV